MYPNASTESLEIIRYNECEHARDSLVTQRFQRLWNEIEHLRIQLANATRSDTEKASPVGTDEFVNRFVNGYAFYPTPRLRWYGYPAPGVPGGTHHRLQQFYAWSNDPNRLGSRGEWRDIPIELEKGVNYQSAAEDRGL